MLRYCLITLALSLVAASGFWMDRQSRPAVVHADLPRDNNIVYASGRVEGATRDVRLRFEIPGRIIKLAVKEGDAVEAGTVLMQLDSEEFVHRVALKEAERKLAESQLNRLRNGAHEQERLEAQAILEARQAELKLASQNWERTKLIREKSAVTQQELDNYRGEMDALTAQVAAAKARFDLLAAPTRADELDVAQARCDAAVAYLRLAQTELTKTQLVAPASGLIAKVSHEAGELTGPDVIEPAVIMVDVRQLRVRAYIEEQDSDRVDVGQLADIQLDGDTRAKVVGRVSFVAPRMSKKQAWSDQADERFDLKTREVLIEVEDSKYLIPGLSVDVSIRGIAK